MKRSISVSTILLAITCAPLLAQNAATSAPQPTAPPATSWKQVAIRSCHPLSAAAQTHCAGERHGGLPHGNHELPFIAGNAMIRGGAETSPHRRPAW